MDKSIKRSKTFVTLAAVSMISIVAVFILTMILVVSSQVMGFSYPDILDSVFVEILMGIVLLVLTLVFSILGIVYSARAKKIDKKYGSRLVVAIIELCLVICGGLFVAFCYFIVEATGGA